MSSGFGFGGYGLGPYGNQPIVSLPTGYYLSLLTSQYQSSPNLRAWLQATLGILDDMSRCLESFITSFDLDYAVGAQLDTLGVIIGQSRTVGFQPSNGVSPILDDTTYRLLLKACIAQNQWTGTIDSLQSIWQQLFPGGRIIIADAQNMTATIIVTGSFTSILIDLITNGYIVPRPEGVLYQFDFGTLPAFGFDLNNAYVAGFDLGHWT